MSKRINNREMKFFLVTGLLVFISLNGFSQETNKDRSMGAPIDVRLDKGDFFIGGTLGLDLKDAENQNQILTTALSENSDNFNLRLDGGYALKNDFFVGLGFVWGVTNRTGEYEDANTGDISDIQYHGTRYSIRPFIKNHLPLTPNRRFNLVVQTELRFSLNQAIEETDLNEIVTRTYREEWGLGIGVRPGLLAFVMNNFAVEASVNVAGIGFSVLEVNETGKPDVNISSANLDLKIDILQLNLGFVTYF
jgi:hypothetical protein